MVATASFHYNLSPFISTIMFLKFTYSGSSGNVKLVGGQSENEGRVEVCVNGGWGTVADDGWTTADGQVVCRQLGYSSSGKFARS